MKPARMVVITVKAVPGPSVLPLMLKYPAGMSPRQVHPQHFHTMQADKDRIAHIILFPSHDLES